MAAVWGPNPPPPPLILVVPPFFPLRFGANPRDLGRPLGFGVPPFLGQIGGVLGAEPEGFPPPPPPSFQSPLWGPSRCLQVLPVRYGAELRGFQAESGLVLFIPVFFSLPVHFGAASEGFWGRFVFGCGEERGGLGAQRGAVVGGGGGMRGGLGRVGGVWVRTGRL